MKVGDYLRHIPSGDLYQYLGNNKFVEIDINFNAHTPYKETQYTVNHFVIKFTHKQQEDFEPVKILILKE
jgi:hypothetical protein